MITFLLYICICFTIYVICVYFFDTSLDAKLMELLIIYYSSSTLYVHTAFIHLPFAKLLDLLAINHSSSEKGIIFVSQSLKFSHVWLFYNFHGCALSRS